MTNENPDTIGLMSAMKELNKTFGDSGLFAGDSEGIEPVDAISSGSLVVDDLIGVGGYPRSRFVQFAGKESSGKTFMSVMVIKEWQKRHPKNWALFIDAEYTYDESWFRSLGVDTSRLMVFKEASAVKIWNLLCGVPKQNKTTKKVTTTPGLLQKVIDARNNDEDDIMKYLGVVVLDSVANMSPPIEESSAVEKQNMAPMARFLSNGLRRLTPLVAKSNVLFIGLNHIHINIGQMYGDPETTSGGRAWKHALSMTVNFAAQNQKDNLIIDDETQDIIGHRVKLKIQKNKCAPIKSRDCEFDIKYVKGIVNRHLEVGELAIKYGVIERPNNVMYEYDDQKWKGRDNFLDALEENEELQKELIEKINEVVETRRNS